MPETKYMRENKTGPSLIWMAWTEDGEHRTAGTSELADMGVSEGIDPWKVLGLAPGSDVEDARQAHQRILEELAAEADDEDETSEEEVEKLRTLFAALAMIEAEASGKSGK